MKIKVSPVGEEEQEEEKADEESTYGGETDLLLGMHAIWPKVTDLIAEGVFAKLVEGTPREIGMSVHVHPSLAEVMGEAAMAVDGNAIHI